ncbi:MAG: creatininase family protein [Alkalicoccus sp.]|nr:MAG: creatininase family protein [Alkalicoccus sp.]
MPTTKNAIHHMTWREAEEAYKKDPVVILPMGSMEEHGPHSLTGDYLAAEELAKRVAENTGALYLPTVPFGNSDYFRSYPGTISLSQETVIRLIDDIFRSLLEHGITKIVVFNGHAGNGPAVDQVARKINRENRIMIVSVDLWQGIDPKAKKAIYGEKDPSGHGGEPLTSLMHYLYPEDMRTDLLPEWKEETTWRNFEIKNFKQVHVGDAAANVFFNMEDVSKEGIAGDPTGASPERGKQIMDHLTSFGSELVEKVAASDMTLGGR